MKINLQEKKRNSNAFCSWLWMKMELVLLWLIVKINNLRSQSYCFSNFKKFNLHKYFYNLSQRKWLFFSDRCRFFFLFHLSWYFLLCFHGVLNLFLFAEYTASVDNLEVIDLSFDPLLPFCYVTTSNLSLRALSFLICPPYTSEILIEIPAGVLLRSCEIFLSFTINHLQT